MEVALKQRLVGASVIIALAVIFIPMLFDNRGVDQNQSIAIEIPEEPENLKQKVINIDTGKFTNGSEPITEDETKDTKTANTTKDNQDPIIKKEETIIDVVDNSNQSTTDNSNVNDINHHDNSDTKQQFVKENDNLTLDISKPSTNVISNDDNVIEPTEGQDSKFYRIKYGVFSLQKNAQQLKAKIINAGHTAIVEKSDDGKLFTVFSEQLSSEQSAIRTREAVEKIKLNIGKPSIITLTDEEALAAELKLDTGWILQIGSFASKTNSIKLRDKIRSKGFVTFVDEITDAKNQKRYRVRIGPYATRDEAQSEKIKIKKSMDLNGLIKPHEKQKVITK